MRLRLSEIVEPWDYFLHADMWNKERFPIEGKIINTGLGEANLLNMAGGLASVGNTVYVYGVAGFIIHRYEQLKFSCRDFGALYGKIIIMNAGKRGYEGIGKGHILDDDQAIMEALDIPFFAPENLDEFNNIMTDINLLQRGIFYIQLGNDYER